MRSSARKISPEAALAMQRWGSEGLTPMERRWFMRACLVKPAERDCDVRKREKRR